MEHIQLSLFGKTPWELFHQITGWILRPCLNRSQTPKFQCLLLESGQMLEWSEGMMLISPGDCWMPNIGESPHSLKEEGVSSSWQILEDHVPQKYYLKPVICNRFLRLAEKAGCPHPLPVEYLLKKQGGRYPSSVLFKNDVCEVQPKKNEKRLQGGFGRTGDPFLTLLAGSVNYFTFWYEGEEKKGFIRQLTPLECERLMGLPEGWTALGNKGEAISDYARYKAIGNAIAVPCAEYIMAGIAEVL